MQDNIKKPIKNISILCAILIFLIIVLYLLSSQMDILVSDRNSDTPFFSDTTLHNGFDETTSQLNTTAKLVAFLNEHFEFTNRKGNIAITPQEFYQNKKGGAQDFAVFSTHVLDKNGFIAFTFIYQHNEEEEYVTVFRDHHDDLPKYIYITQEGARAVHYGWSFTSLVIREQERLGITINRYATLTPSVIELIPSQWTELQ